MERIRSSCRTVHHEYRRTVEWRSPLTGLYLMAVNSAFWVGVIYCDARLQEALLMTSAACIFAWDVLLSSSHERSIISHVLLWPVQSVFRTLSVVGAFYSVHLLREQDVQVACWSAYATLAGVLINPVWEYNEVNAKIGRTCKRGFEGVKHVVNVTIVNPVVTVYEYAMYIVLLQWIPPLFAYIKHFVFNFRQACGELATGIQNWFQVQLVERSKRVAQRVYCFFRYWICAEWWPELKIWSKKNLGVPLRVAFDNICFWLVYIFCFHWFPPLYRFFLRQLAKFGRIVYTYVIGPVNRFLLREFDRFRGWLRAKLHQLAIAIRDSIVWPVCVIIVEATKQVSIMIYNILLEPIISYIYGRYKIVETSALIYILGPVCETVIEHIPEKNPFCDESDVEYDGFLPEVVAEEDLDENYEAEEVASTAPSSPLPEEEHEFERGLKFTAINGSESSDDEFDLHSNRKVEQVRRKRKDRPEKIGDADNEFEYLE